MLDLLYPLSEFLNHGRPVPLDPREVDGARLPEPYRGLLVHDSDMTSTLEAFHGEELGLRLLERRQIGSSLFRQVTLVGRDSGRPLEFGAIRIDLEGFTPAARRAIQVGLRPLGTILSHFRIAYESRPRHFFCLESDRRIEDVFALSRPCTLYGRQNVLRASSGSPLAEVVEILPPVTAAEVEPRLR